MDVVGVKLLLFSMKCDLGVVFWSKEYSGEVWMKCLKGR